MRSPTPSTAAWLLVALLASCAAAPSPPPDAAVADASPDALAAVPGVGPALAQAIHDALNPG